jgi:hypothetical protein
MSILRGFIAVIATLVILLVGNAAPAYAGSTSAGTQPGYAQIMIEHKGNNDSYSFNNSFNRYEKTDDFTEEFGSGIARGLGTGVGVAVGAAATCYILDGIATMFFPPAAALAPTCGYVGGLAGGATAFSIAP